MPCSSPRTGRRRSLWLVVVLLVATLLQVRNAFGVVSVLVTGAVVGAVAWWGDATLQGAFAAAMAWFLLFGALRSVRELQRGRRRGRFRASATSRTPTRSRGSPACPAECGRRLFWFAAVVAVITGAWVLVRGIA